MNKIRRVIRAKKQQFKQEKHNPSPKTVLKRRRQLQQGGKARQNQPNKVVQRVVPQRQQQSKGLTDILKEQIKQGGRQAVMEWTARSQEFRSEHQIRDGVMGTDVKGLKEERDEKVREVKQKLERSDT